MRSRQTVANGARSGPRVVARAALAAFITLSFFTIEASAQQPPVPPAFRSTTQLVLQTVAVKDRDGRAVEGLTTRDFTVIEAGDPQEIAFVEFQRLGREPGTAPVAITQVERSSPSSRLTAVAGAAPGIAPADTASAPARPSTMGELAVPFPGDTRYQDRRLLVFYFDNSAMSPPEQVRAYISALRYIDKDMAPADLVAVMACQRGSVSVKTDFTHDRSRLREVIQVLMDGDDRNNDGIPDNPEGSEFGQNDVEFNIFNTDRQLSALQTAVSMLLQVSQQKTLLYFAGGLRLNGVDNQAQLRATVNAAIRANVTLNPIDARGLVATPPLGDATRPSAGGVGMFTGALAERALDLFQRSQDTLYALAKDTGGQAMVDYNDLALGIVQAARAANDYYIIGYYSTHVEADGRYRRVRITLNRQIEAEVTHRTGYYADKKFGRFTDADKERQLEEAMMLAIPVTDITVAVELNYFQLNRAEYFVPVAVKIPGSELELAHRRGAARTLIDFIAEIKDDYGYTVQNVRDKLDIRLSDITAKELSSRPLQYETGFTLLPGRYVVKILARDSTTGRIGTFQAAFAIPNLIREARGLPISSVVIGSQRVPMTKALHTIQDGAAQVVHPLVYEGQKLFPSVTRVFSRRGQMYVFLQAYERDAETTQPLVVFLSFFRQGEKVLETEPHVVTDRIDPNSKAVPIRLSLPLDGLGVGGYECQVSVLEPNGRKVAFWRAPVAIVP